MAGEKKNTKTEKLSERLSRYYHGMRPGHWVFLIGVGSWAAYEMGIDSLIEHLNSGSEGSRPITLDASLLNELTEDGFDFDNKTIRSQILSSNGFDVTRVDGSEEHWEIKFNKDGTVNDVFKVSDHNFGTGPALHENTSDKVSHWQYMTAKFDRHLTDEDYAAAKAYYESHGSHLYKPGDPISTAKLQAILSEFKQHGINSHEVNQIIKKYGGLVDESGCAYEIWMSDKGPVLHQVPAHLRPNFPHLTPDGHWKDSAGTLIKLTK